MNINSQKRGDILADITSAGELDDNQKLKTLINDSLMDL